VSKSNSPDPLAAGAPCDACVKQDCNTTKHECNPAKHCNVCPGCCQSFIADGKPCDDCVKQECEPTPSPCAAHDGTLDPTTGNCTNCAGAWGGPACDVYDAKVPIAQQVTMMEAVANMSQKMLDDQVNHTGQHISPITHQLRRVVQAKAFHPLCRQRSTQCVGWGAKAFGEGTGQS
jgi:hypothetical protein